MHGYLRTCDARILLKDIRQPSRKKEYKNPGEKMENEGLRNQRSPLHQKSGVRFSKAAQTQNASPWNHG